MYLNRRVFVMINLSPQCNAFSRALKIKKLKAPLFPVPGTTNDWCTRKKVLAPCGGKFFPFTKKKKKKKKLRRVLTCDEAIKKSQKLFPLAGMAKNLTKQSA